MGCRESDSDYPSSKCLALLRGKHAPLPCSNFSWSGCWESNPDYIHPMDAYCHYTTARKFTSGPCMRTATILHPVLILKWIKISFSDFIIQRYYEVRHSFMRQRITRKMAKKKTTRGLSLLVSWTCLWPVAEQTFWQLPGPNVLRPYKKRRSAQTLLSC